MCFASRCTTSTASTQLRPEPSKQVRAYYLAQAKGHFLTVLAKTASLLVDLRSLKYIGFETDMHLFARRGAETREDLQRLLAEDDLLAQQAWDLVVALLHTRCCSLAWRCGSWPSLLALFASPEKEDCQRALYLLRLGWEAYTVAEELAGGSRFLGKVVQKPPRSTTLMKEV